MQNRSSYLMLVASMLIFGTIGIFRRLIPLSSPLLACARGIMGAAFLLLIVRARGRKLFWNMGRRDVGLFLLTGACIGLNWMFLFEAYNYTTVATATLCYYMQPTIVILLSPIFLGESLSSRKLLRAGIAIAGMVLVSGILESRVTGLQLKGIFFGLAAAALYSAVVILNKKAPSADAYDKTIIQLFAAALIMIPYLLWQEDFMAIHLNTTAMVMLLVVGIVHTGIAYAFYFAGMTGVKSQTIAILSYIDPVSALMLSALFLKESMSIYAVIGAVLIIGTAIWDGLDKEKEFTEGDYTV